uniref:Heme exporter protein D n=1 Tax=Candidatus Kentrum sp. MB TaxID=2138164 RepID=A0A450XYZ4_9GAMM|nr:MAG: heme exporter protein D [Candidatus Kentron sp. MB]VFK34485.1 MAG: heme exporter protein D [Candidatus Kentron sp. MB]VFK76780.1 MAG: heme exporter protein D [Candidatus Kentron sp. MB]
MMEFFHMGGYAPYVWSAYGLTFVILLINLIQPRLCQRRIEKELTRKAKLAKKRP